MSAPEIQARPSQLLPPTTIAGFSAAIVAVLFITLMSYRSLSLRAVTSDRVTHTLNFIERLDTVLSATKDAETGQRGYLLTGKDSYLEPHLRAKAELPGDVDALRELADSPSQVRRLGELQRLITEKLEELGETITHRRAGDAEGALAIVLTDRGKNTMDRIRILISEMQVEEHGVLAARQEEWREATIFAAFVTWGGSGLLLFLIIGAALITSRDYRARETEAWLRQVQMALSGRMQGEQRLDSLGHNVLSLLAESLGAQVGSISIAEGDGGFRRFAGYALPPGSLAPVIRPGDGLVGQAARDNRSAVVRELPDDYLPISSTLGRGKPRSLLVAPAATSGVVQAVLELGFLRPVVPTDVELLTRVSELVAIAVRSSKDRTRLEELLDETQRQAEELQTQQEELRVSNEELAEQARALKESQARLEAQQAEMEETNTHLEEQTRRLEDQKEELTESQTSLTQKAEELERSNHYKSEFLANMSHELRTPLNSSLILAKLLADNKDGNLTAEQVKFAQTISSAGNDLLDLIGDILDLSKIEAGSVEVEKETFALASALRSITETFQPMAQQRKLGFEVVIEAEVPREMQTDSRRLAQILKNLLSNALKFTEKGQVSLRVAPQHGDQVSFSVRDTGIGIPSPQQEIIFEAFRQADGSTHRKYGGTGLGLTISRDLARLLGGDIAVHSTPGEGSTFTLTLPVIYSGRADGAPRPPARPSTPAPSGASAPASSSRSSAPRVEDDRESLNVGSRVILVVEDDLRFAAILRDLAHERGFQCVIAHSAREALAAMGTFSPSAVVLDVNLPDQSGMEVLDRLKRDPATRHIPVHMLSVADYAQQALGLGAVGYALKPVKREELIEAFRKLETKFAQGLRRVLVVEDDARQLESVQRLLSGEGVEVLGASSANQALEVLNASAFDCVVLDLNLPDMTGYNLLERMAERADFSFQPVIIYTGGALTRDEEQRLQRYSKSIIIKGARSPERLLDEVTLFLHQVEAKLPLDRQKMLKEARDRDADLDGRQILVVEDDVRNVFALSSILEPTGAKVLIARNGREALDVLGRTRDEKRAPIDLVFMDIMMPEMDGLTAMREIRLRPEWKKLPIIVLSAKAMKDDWEKCFEAGANDYIAKPLDVDRLLSLARVWMPK